MESPAPCEQKRRPETGLMPCQAMPQRTPTTAPSATPALTQHNALGLFVVDGYDRGARPSERHRACPSPSIRRLLSHSLIWTVLGHPSSGTPCSPAWSGAFATQPTLRYRHQSLRLVQRLTGKPHEAICRFLCAMNVRRRCDATESAAHSSPSESITYVHTHVASSILQTQVPPGHHRGHD